MRLRPPRDDDFDAMLELMQAHDRAVFGEVDTTEENLRTWLTSPSVDVERDVRVLEDGGRLVGYADVDPTRDEPPLWWCDVKAAPDSDADWIAAELVRWLEERAQVGTLRVWTSADHGRSVAIYERLGFVRARHSYRMELELDEEPRAPVWPERIAVRTVGEQEHERLYEVIRDVWRDTSDPLDETFDEWAHWTVKAAAFDPTLWFLAVDGDAIAGFSLCREDATDPTAGYVATLGVCRGDRRQGLGEALLLHSFRELRRRGYRRATLGVDAASPTGATRLYERAGMRVYRDTVFMQKALAA